MPRGHASDCAMHNGPARWPGRCNCGSIKVGNKSFSSWPHRFAYTLGEAVRNECWLWQCRWLYLSETYASRLEGEIVAMLSIVHGFRHQFRRRVARLGGFFAHK